jgi:hypothetical protein
MISQERHQHPKHHDYRILSPQEIEQLLLSYPVIRRRKFSSLETIAS